MRMNLGVWSKEKNVFCCLLMTLLFCQGSVLAEQARLVEHWELINLPTEHRKNLNISAIAMNAKRSLMVLGSDEQSAIQILSKQSEGRYELVKGGDLALSQELTELDIEGIARDGNRYWIIGSHSMKRMTLKTVEELKEKDAKKHAQGKGLSKDYNHARLQTVEIEPTREWLYRLEIKSNGKLKKDSILRVSLRNILANHPVLSRFRDIPGKENGIDIEGLAVIPDDNGSNKTTMLVCLRGPSLRGPRAVVLVIEVKEQEADDSKPALEVELKDTRYLALEGRGIRGISEMNNKDDGYLVLAGPVGDELVSYQLYHWSGKDTIPEIDELDAEDNLVKLCEIPLPDNQPDAKAEGVQFLDQHEGKVQFVVVYDAAVNGAATVFSCNL